MAEIPLTEWQKQHAMREADRADDYTKLLAEPLSPEEGEP